jgi:hypothetical protein
MFESMKKKLTPLAFQSLRHTEKQAAFYFYRYPLICKNIANPLPRLYLPSLQAKLQLARSRKWLLFS